MMLDGSDNPEYCVDTVRMGLAVDEKHYRGQAELMGVEK
jgi:hypothetical protein